MASAPPSSPGARYEAERAARISANAARLKQLVGEVPASLRGAPSKPRRALAPRQRPPKRPPTAPLRSSRRLAAKDDPSLPPPSPPPPHLPRAPPRVRAPPHDDDDPEAAAERAAIRAADLRALNEHRVATMSEAALARRVSKITVQDKLADLISVLRSQSHPFAGAAVDRWRGLFGCEPPSV